LIIQANSFNRSQIQTVIVAVITSKISRAEAPGNVFLPAESTGLPRDSVANVSQLMTLDRRFVTDEIGKIPANLLAEVDAGLRLILAL
jgi:mRNA interferase MazF